MVGERPNVRFVFGDCLARKNELNPDMLAAWDEAAKQHGCTRRKLVANLPYVIATPLISNLLIARTDIERMVVMVQWEIAERMRAVRRHEGLQRRSRVLVQSVADVEVVRKVLPTNFHPRPKVDSAIVLIKPNAEKRAKVGDVPKFRVFLRDLYVHRRKNLRQALIGLAERRNGQEGRGREARGAGHRRHRAERGARLGAAPAVERGVRVRSKAPGRCAAFASEPAAKLGKRRSGLRHWKHVISG